MYKLIKVIKFNDQYFENGDVVAVTTKDNSVAVGGIIISDRYINDDYNTTTDWNLYINTSERYKTNIKRINYQDIINIQKVG